jgi:methionyl-tRNA formyltransferase
MMEAQKIVFFGTPEFAVDSLKELVDKGCNVTAVITVPDQPAGRGLTLRRSPVKQFAEKKGLHVLQPERLKDPEFIERLQSFDADLFVVVAFRMLPEVVWAMPRLGTFNLHASLLPQYRGAAPINHVIMNGESETGITTFFLRHEIDTGNIIFQEKMEVFPEETAGELHDRMKPAGAKLVFKTVKAIFKGNVKTFDQQGLVKGEVKLKAAPKITKEDCRIKWNKSTTDVFNKIRGLSPYPAAHTTLISPKGESYHIKIYKGLKGQAIESCQPGMITTDGKTCLKIATSDGTIGITELQQAGKNRMDIVAFLRGFRINSSWKTGKK